MHNHDVEHRQLIINSISLDHPEHPIRDRWGLIQTYPQPSCLGQESCLVVPCEATSIDKAQKTYQGLTLSLTPFLRILVFIPVCEVKGLLVL